MWRRRRCQECNAVFTTYEATYLPNALSVKTDTGQLEPYLPGKLYSDILDSLKDRVSPYLDAQELTDTVTQRILRDASKGPINAQEISKTASEVLKRFNRQAWLRYMANHPSVQPNR